jgi:ParB family chromosome partitioning protein
MAEALGVSRAELYRLLSFASLPDFVQADLQAQPELLGSAAAEGILSVLKQHGVTAESKLAPLWAKLKQGTLGQLALVAKLRNEFKPMRAPTVAMDSTELFTGTKRIGRIKSDGKSFILHFKASAISKDQMQQLRDLATRFFP